MHDRSADRVYLLLPGHLRAHDHDGGRPLQALFRILTRELDVVEADIQTLYDNWFIETCEDWVVSYMGDLVGARRLRPFGEGGGSLRGYVANTLGYRQAKGTIAAIEQLARDVTGWPAHAVEFYRRLVPTQNVNHVRLNDVTTMSLRNADAATQTGTAFETSAHVIDVRRDGRYNIPNVGIFLWRLQSVWLPFLFPDDADYRGGVQPARSTFADGCLHLDPLGRDVPLFNRARTEPAMAHLAREVDLPGRLRRRPVHDDLEDLRAGEPDAGAYFRPLPVFRVRLDGSEVGTPHLHCCNLEDIDDGAGGTVWRRPAEPGHVFFDPELGRMSLHPSDENASVEAACAYGAAHDIGGGAYNRRPSVDAWMADYRAATDAGTLWHIGVTRRQTDVTGNVNQGGPVVATLAEAVERWNAVATESARGIITILDNGSYLEDLTGDPHVVRIPAGASLAIVAAGWPLDEVDGARRRRLGALSPQDRRPFVGSGLRVWGIAGRPAGHCEPRSGPWRLGADAWEESGVARGGGTFIVDGLLVGGTITVTDGDLSRIEIRHCTVGAASGALSPGLIVGRGNERLDVVLDHAISGAVDLGDASASLTVADSVIGQDASADPEPTSVPLVVAAPSADLDVRRSTIFGRIDGRTLEADATIFVGPPWIARRQQGCIRFSYVPAGARVPRRYRCAPELTLGREKERLGRELSAGEVARIQLRLRPVFASSVCGDPAFAQLALTCASEISEGAEQGSEMGAMNALGNPARVANLRDALVEYLPLGLQAGIVFVT